MIININLKLKLIIYYCPVQKNIVNKFLNIGIPVVSMGKFMSDDIGSIKLEKIFKFNDICCIIYDSDNIIKPTETHIIQKNILQTSKNILFFLKSKCNIKELSNEQIISYLPLSHILPQILDIYIPILTISTVWFASENIDNILKTIKEINPTIFMGFSYVWEKIQFDLEEIIDQNGWKANIVKKIAPWKIKNELGLNKCKYCFTTSDILTETCKSYFESLNIIIYEIYGTNESSGIISISGPLSNKKLSNGLCLSETKISNNSEIIVKGDNINFKKKSKSWFKTGELGKIDDTGYLYIIGKKKDIITLANGYKFSPQQIEKMLKEKLFNYFQYITVIGSKRKYLSIILNRGNRPNKPDNNIINNTITYVNNILNNKLLFIKKWLILPDIYTLGNELTCTYKLKRDFVEHKYKKIIDTLYKK